jgi:hypothetical protein
MVKLAVVGPASVATESKDEMLIFATSSVISNWTAVGLTYIFLIGPADDKAGTRGTGLADFRVVRGNADRR